MALPSFLKRDREIELPPLPTTAIVERTNGKVDLPDMDGQQFDEMERVGIYAKQARGKLRETQIQLTETTLRLESARRENGELQVRIAQLQNDVQALQSQNGSLRHENSDLRALLSSIRLQLDHARIPLPPVWELLRQTQKDEVAHVSGPTPVDRPANETDPGAGSVDPAA